MKRCVLMAVVLVVLSAMIESSEAGIRTKRADCKCYNPWAGNPNKEALGDPSSLCEGKEHKEHLGCYVRYHTSCNDKKRAAGGGRLQSKEACRNLGSKGVDNRPSPTQPANTCFCASGLPSCHGEANGSCIVNRDADCNDKKWNLRNGNYYSSLACRINKPASGGEYGISQGGVLAHSKGPQDYHS